MTAEQRPKGLHIALWIAQGLLAAFMLSGTVLKFMPIEKISAMMPWTGQVSPVVVRILGIVDLIGAAGLILPAMLHVQPRLTVWAAIGIILLMVCAIVFHLSRGEATVIGANLFALALALFIAWGRAMSVPIR